MEMFGHVASTDTVESPKCDLKTNAKCDPASCWGGALSFCEIDMICCVVDADLRLYFSHFHPFLLSILIM